MEIFVGLMVFVLGLCVGSFINMLVYRTAVKYGLHKVKKGFLKERSVCDFCGKQLHWYENIPICSWILLGGRTKCCHKKLPILYPIVELATGIIFGLSLMRSPMMIYDWRAWVGLILLTLMIFSTVFDIKYMILPDFSTVLMIMLAIFLSGFSGVLAAIGASGFLLLLHLVTKGKGMGFGDVKLALFMGLLLGIKEVIVAFYFAFIVGAIVGVGLMIVNKVGRKSPVPFGPFLLLGTLLSWWYGSTIWYIVFNR